MKRTFLLITAAATFAGCSTELDINAPYKDISVVYGLLNMRDSVHLVKINKAYLGEGDAYTFAQIADSNEYQGEDITYAKVFRIGSSGAVIDSFPLDDTLITNREPGNFYSPVQKLFYFRTPFAQMLPPLNGTRMYLWQDDRYELRLRAKGNTITGSTEITNDFSIAAQDQSLDAEVNLMNPVGTGYGNYEFNWTARSDCKRFVISYRLRYDEIRGNDTLPRAITQKLGTRVTENSQNNEELAIIFSGESFYSTVSTVIRSDGNHASADRRIFRGFDFLVEVANDDFHTYLTLTEPISGIIEDRPSYSNVTGAYGVWGSRTNKNVIGKWLNPNSIEELINGGHTGDLNFCVSIAPGGPLLCD